MSGVQTIPNNLLRAFLDHEYNYPFTGWDFAHIRDRFVTSPLNWSYASRVLATLRSESVETMLDMGTGGGEFLLQNFQPFPPQTHVTEQYLPNIPVVKSNLEPLGVQVHEVTDDTELPFSDNTFDLVLNQHESFSSSEVYRILKPGHSFVTKQVDGDNDKDLQTMLGAPVEESEWHLSYAVEDLEAAGFHVVEKYEGVVTARVFDVGALVYYCKIIPWAIPDFSVDKYFPQLEQIHQTICEKSFVELRNPRFMIVAVKPKNG